MSGYFEYRVTYYLHSPDPADGMRERRFDDNYEQAKDYFDLIKQITEKLSEEDSEFSISNVRLYKIYHAEEWTTMDTAFV